MKRHGIRLFLRAAALALLSCLLTSCGSAGGALYNNVMSFLGFDMNDYESEPATRILTADDEECAEMLRIIDMLTLDSVRLVPFETPREAAAGNRDAILNYMLNNGYAAYSGNSELLERAAEEYPQYSITTLIPEADLESTVYKCFGGDASVRHGNSVRYTYLSRVSAYTTTGLPLATTVTVTLSNICETEHTYRVSFTVTGTEGEGGAEVSENYTAMFMKREDETIYMRFLRAADE